MERKRLVNRANFHHDFRLRRAFRLRESYRPNVVSFGAVAVVSLAMASCADYESAYQQSVENYLGNQPRETASDAPAEAAPPADAGITPGVPGNAGGPPGGNPGSGSGGPEGFSPVGSGAAGVIVPGS